MPPRDYTPFLTEQPNAAPTPMQHIKPNADPIAPALQRAGANIEQAGEGGIDVATKAKTLFNETNVNQGQSTWIEGVTDSLYKPASSADANDGGFYTKRGDTALASYDAAKESLLKSHADAMAALPDDRQRNMFAALTRRNLSLYLGDMGRYVDRETTQAADAKTTALLGTLGQQASLAGAAGNMEMFDEAINQGTGAAKSWGRAKGYGEEWGNNWSQKWVGQTVANAAEQLGAAGKLKEASAMVDKYAPEMDKGSVLAVKTKLKGALEDVAAESWARNTIYGASPDAPDLGAISGKIMSIEGTGKNPRSSAEGGGQFTNATWLETIRGARPDIADKSDAELLEMRKDPQLAGAMTENYAARNAQTLTAANLPATPGNVYLAHFLGPQGAIKALSADPDTPIASLVGDRAMAANPQLAGKTAGDVAKWADLQMAGVGGSVPGAGGSPGAISDDEYIRRQGKIGQNLVKVGDNAFLNPTIQGSAAGTWESESGGKGEKGPGYTSPKEHSDAVKSGINQTGGGFSTEKTITFSHDGKVYVASSIINGKAYTADAAIDEFKAGRNPAIGIFDNEDDANAFAEQRSADLDAVYGGKGQTIMGPSSPVEGGLRGILAAAGGDRSAIKMDKARTYAQADAAFAGDPAMQRKVGSAINRMYASMQLDAAARQQEAQERNAKAYTGFADRILANDPADMRSFIKDLHDNPDLTGEHKLTLMRSAEERAKKGLTKDDVTYGSGFSQTLRAIDEGQLKHDDDIWKQTYDHTDEAGNPVAATMTAAGAEKASAHLKRRYSPKDFGDAELDRAARASAEGLLSNEMEIAGVKIPDPNGKRIFENRFLPAYYAALKQGVDKQLTYSQMLTEGSKDYIIGPLLERFKRTPAQNTADAINAREAVTARVGIDVAPPPAPEVGKVVDGYRFKGGNPAEETSWEAVAAPQAPVGR